MIYKYEMACQEAGLSEEKIKEIRQIFDTDKKKLKRENEAMEKYGITYHNIFDVDPEYDFLSYQIKDESVNLEQDMIKNWEIEQLMRFMQEFSENDRKLLLLSFESAKVNDSSIAKELGIPRTTLQSRRKKLIEKLQKRFAEENIERI